MATHTSAMTAKSVLAKISEGHLECSICSNRFTEPKMLECLHSFCLECLVELKERVNPYSSMLKCPVCRGDTKLKGNNVEELPSDFTLSSLVEEVAKQEELLEGQGSSESSLEFQCLSEKWRLETEVGGYIPEWPSSDTFRHTFHVAAFSDNVAVAVQYGMSKLIHILASGKPKSPVLCHEVEIKGLTKPRRLAVNKDDELIVLNYSDDKPEVKVYNRQKELLHHFDLDEDVIIAPSCLAVNENNQIAIGSSYRQNIVLFSSDGSLIDTLSDQKVSEHMTCYKQRLIYSYLRWKKLRSIDTNGDEIFAVGMPSDCPDSMGPAGVCCDKDGDIYVAMNVDWSSSGGEIHRFSADGEHIGCVIKGCGSPRGITLTPNGDLVVAARESVSIYHPV
ncbi:tripartite motif-containing protein 5-like [Patiria miniata]|uniref:RING-type domain-containing protein n=1 Tax=Patiria miniata TaxID=46514 RepID=A0A914A473_PATMI|nr:tripartite motif-containing protein 5-like [Patiria miniata]